MGEVGCWCGTFSPCSTCWWRKRYKVLPAGVKRAEMGHFGGAGRVLYRCRPLGCELGEFCTGIGPACGTKFSLLDLLVVGAV